MGTPSTKRAFWQALGYAWQFGYTVAVPLIVFALAGRLLDRHYHASPWFLVGGVVVSIALSSLLLVRKAMAILRSLDQHTSQENQRDHSQRTKTHPPSTPAP